MREYELMYIARPSLEPEQYEALQERVTTLISSNGGEMTGVDVWGKRRLGYPIKHENDGHYVVLTFKGGEELIRELDRILSITDEFLRFKIFRIDQHKKKK
jgi:small subunit ribosomal protein S6